MIFSAPFLLVSAAIAAAVVPPPPPPLQHDTSACPFNYPISLNTTNSARGLVLTIILGDAKNNHRAVQLRPDTSAEGVKDGILLAGIDPASEVLLANLDKGHLLSEALNQLNQVYVLAPTGFIIKHSESTSNGTSTTKYIVAFASPDRQPKEAEEPNWTLDFGTSEGEYWLYHHTESGLSHGFALCNATTGGGGGGETGVEHWQQLFYTRTSGVGAPAGLEGCDFIGVKTTVAPNIMNGECNMPPE